MNKFRPPLLQRMTLPGVFLLQVRTLRQWRLLWCLPLWIRRIPSHLPHHFSQTSSIRCIPLYDMSLFSSECVQHLDPLPFVCETRDINFHAVAETPDMDF